MRSFGFRAAALSAVLGALGLLQTASASPVTMNYCTQDAGGGLTQYTFTLTLDNNDNTWVPGYGIGWVVFGDVPNNGTSPITDFVMDPSSFPIGPWTQLTGSGGGHNGPTLGPVVEQTDPYPILYWVPNAVGDSITWRGTSSHLATTDELQWSCLFAQSGIPVDFTTISNICGPTGACCLSTGCRILPESNCTAQGGTYGGNGSLCTSCPAVGACCGASGCTQLTQAACGAAGGNWQGANTSCPTTSYNIASSSSTFVDISTTGTNVTSQLNGCDDGGASIPLPFNFSFFGSSYSSAWICSNGFLQFGSANSTDYYNQAPPSPSDPRNAIYACWDDLYVCTVGNLYTQVNGSAPNRSMIFSWQGVAKYDSQSNGSQNFQVVLFEGSNNIELRYGSMAPDAGGGAGPDGSDYTIGVENSTGTSAQVIDGSAIGSGSTARLLTYSPGTCGPVCGSADFNCDGDTGTDADIEAFFACIAGACPPASCGQTADFNGDGDTGTDADIEAFFRVLGGGNC